MKLQISFLTGQVTQLRSDNQVLKSENLSLKKTKNNVEFFPNRVRKLHNENLSLNSKNASLTEENNRVKAELQELKEKIRLQDPLVNVGVKIRRRFFEQAKELHGGGPPLWKIVEAGNEAAHRGDFLADSAMFQLGHMKVGDVVVALEDIEGIWEDHELFKMIYNVDQTTTDGAAAAKTYPPKMIELCNLTGTLNSSSSWVQHGRFENFNCAIFEQIWESCKTRWDDLAHYPPTDLSSSQETFDTHPRVVTRVQELNHLLEDALRPSRSRRRERYRSLPSWFSEFSGVAKSVWSASVIHSVEWTLDGDFRLIESNGAESDFSGHFF